MKSSLLQHKVPQTSSDFAELRLKTTLKLICHISYEQEDLPFGEEEVIICNEPDKVTKDDMGSYYLVETCVHVNEDDVPTNECEWQCTTAFEDKPEEEEGCNTPCPPGFESDKDCICKEVSDAVFENNI